MRGKRNGVLSDAETYEARYGAKRTVADIAESEGVTPGAIQMRLSQERKRRQAAGKVVHRSKAGRQRMPRKMVRGKLVAVPLETVEIRTQGEMVTTTVTPDPPKAAPVHPVERFRLAIEALNEYLAAIPLRSR